LGLYDFVSDYEYHLVREGNEWRITSLLYVDADGKYECLYTSLPEPLWLKGALVLT
jgi:hypothetical protein